MPSAHVTTLHVKWIHKDSVNKMETLTVNNNNTIETMKTPTNNSPHFKKGKQCV